MSALLWLWLLRHRGAAPVEVGAFPWAIPLLGLALALVVTAAGLLRIRYGRGEPDWAWMACMLFLGRFGFVLGSMAKQAKGRA